MTQYKQDILDIETDFQCEVEEFVRQDKISFPSKEEFLFIL